jgi:hypothetical protein
VNQAICRLLFIETDIGMNFASAAMNADSTTECLHHRRLARRAYDTACKWTHRANLSEREAKSFKRKLRRLRLTLKQLGEPF